jgi:hypothetical protein
LVDEEEEFSQQSLVQENENEQSQSRESIHEF